MVIDSIFKDLVVVELANALAGPSVGMFFAELGAQVIKIENVGVGGDVTRRWKLTSEADDDPYSAYYFCTNWGKEVSMMNLKDPKDQSKVNDLVKKADIVIANFKSGSAAKLKMDYEALSSINARIIYGSITAYGEDDPRPGFDALIQAETGWMSMNGSADGLPTKIPLPLIDILAGHQLKQGLLVALLQREQTGEGCKVSASLYDSSLAALANQSSTYLNLDITPKRMGSAHPSISPYGDVVRTSDGIDYLLAVGTDDHFANLSIVIGRPELSSDERYINNHCRLENRKSLMSIIGTEVRNMTAEEFEHSCDTHNVPLGPVRDLAQVFADKKAKDLILEEKLENGRISKRVQTVVFKITKSTQDEV